MQALHSIREEEKKLAEIRQVTYQRMNETTRRLEEKAAAQRHELEQAMKNVHNTVKTLNAQPINYHLRRIEALLKKRPSIEDLVYRGIYVNAARRHSREIAQEVLSNMLTARRRNSGSYSASWMFSSAGRSWSSSSLSDDGMPRADPAAADNTTQPQPQPQPQAPAQTHTQAHSDHHRRVREFQHLLQKEHCLIDFREITDQRLVAEGAFAHVYKGQWRGLTVAVKLLKPRENALRICQAEVICLLLV